MSKGKIYTTYFKNIDKAIGIKISIASSNPAWLKIIDYDDWIIELSPGWNNVDKIKNGLISREEFTNKVKTRLRFNSASVKTVTDLLDQGKDVTLLCYEKPTDFCHRHIVREHIMNLGYDGGEII